MCTTSSSGNQTTASPSVCAGGTWNTRASRPPTWKAIESVNVSAGSARGGAAGIVTPKVVLCCSTAIRRRTASCATISAPAAAMAESPPT